MQTPILPSSISTPKVEIQVPREMPLIGQGEGYDWCAAANQLVVWTSERLINRTDCYGAYLPLASRVGRSASYTAPRQDERNDGALAHERIERHFRGEDHGQLIGLHAISKQNTSRWFVIDIDQHSEDHTNSTSNLVAAIHWWDELRHLEFDPLLLDSNGAGGFHLLTIFSEPVRSSTVHSFANWVVRDFGSIGLAQPPEVFPKQPEVNPQRPYGSWWRLPGRHHTREHYTRVWDGEGWLSGRHAIARLNQCRGDKPNLIPSEVHSWRPPSIQLPALEPMLGQAQENNWANLLRGVTTGRRHDTLTRIVGRFLAHGLTAAEVRQLCLLWNAQNQPPLEENELTNVVRDLDNRQREARMRRAGQSSSLRTWELPQ